MTVKIGKVWMEKNEFGWMVCDGDPRRGLVDGAVFQEFRPALRFAVVKNLLKKEHNGG